MLLKNKKYPLDYLLEVPLNRLDRRISLKDHEAMQKRRNLLKNICFRIVIDIREVKKKPKLGDLLKLLDEKLGNEISHEEKQKKKQQILAQLYGKKGDNELQFAHQDIKYEKLMSSFDRLFKGLNINLNTLEFLEKKVFNLQKRRQEREQLGGKQQNVLRNFINKNEKTYTVVQKFRNLKF